MLNTSMTMTAALYSEARSRPDQEVFISSGGVRLSNRQILCSVEAAARGLAARSVGNGDRVATLLPPGPEFVQVFFAAARLGAVMVPLNPDLRDSTLERILSDCEPRLVLRPGEVPSADGGELPADSAAPGDLLALLYTSGTTGTPKATMHTHASLIAPVVATLKVREAWVKPSSARGVVDAVKAVARYRTRLLRAIGKPQTILSTTGWHGITGLHVMLQGLLMGDRLAAMARFHPVEAMEIVQREKVTVMVAVPTAWQAMLALPDVDRYDTSSLIACASGGAACPPPLAREIQRRFGCAVYNGFGMTEVGGGIAVSTLADSDEQQAQTVGRPMPGLELKVVDDERRPLPAGSVGELAVRGEGVMSGYYHSPEQTSQALDSDGWLYTGDLARIDERGYLRIVGRKKDLIIRGGQNIYPAEVEQYLGTHPAIREAAVVGVPSPVAGESVWAFLVLRDQAQLTVQQVLDYCRGKLELYKIPSEVRFVGDLPRGEHGKLLKFRLREAAMQEGAGGTP